MNQSELKDTFSYDPNVGDFIRLKSPRGDRVGKVAGATDSHGHIQIKIKGKLYLAHRLAWLYMTGSFPDHQIDHIDHNRSNNKWDNLRPVSNATNCKNRGMHSKNTSGHVGVGYHKLIGKWMAYATVNYKRELSYHDTKEEAITARQEMSERHGFHPNHGTD